MYEISGLEFGRTTAGREPEPDSLKGSRAVVTVLIIWGYGVSDQFDNGKQVESSLIIKIRVLRKDFGRQICLIRYRKYLRSTKQRRNSTFTVVENTTPDLSKFPGSDRLPRFIKINKFGSFKNHVSTFTSLSELSPQKQQICSVDANEGNDVYEQCQQHQQAKTDSHSIGGLKTTGDENSRCYNFLSNTLVRKLREFQEISFFYEWTSGTYDLSFCTLTGFCLSFFQVNLAQL